MITLRKFDETDIPFLLRLLNDARVLRHIAQTEKFELPQARAFIVNKNRHWDKYSFGAGMMEVDDNPAGWGGLQRWKENEFELALVLDPACWGLGRRFYEYLIDKAWNEYKLEAVYILLPDTRKSHGYLYRLGFVKAGAEIFNGREFSKYRLSNPQLR